AKRVLAVYELRINSSSKTIARTEVLSANNAGTVFGYKQSGVVEKKEWLATPDGRTRDSHSDMNGEVVLVDKDFSNGLEFPGDPSGAPEEIINCRCTTIPVISD
ncbi:MAG: phage minor head protein, partial [Bacteroidales bacterium]|nr:phage minor head protein [Bacteroidales bacterium]